MNTISPFTFGRRGRPVEARTDAEQIKNVFLGVYARRLGVPVSLLTSRKRILAHPTGWPIRPRGEQVIDGDFMQELARCLPYPRYANGTLKNEGKFGSAGGAIWADGSIYGRVSYSEKFDKLSITPVVEIAQSGDPSDLMEFQTDLAIHSSIDRVDDSEDPKSTKAPFKLVYLSTFAVAAAAITFPFMKRKKKEALALAALYYEGLIYFESPGWQGWPLDIWNLRLDWVEALCSYKQRHNRHAKDWRALVRQLYAGDSSADQSERIGALGDTATAQME